MSRIGRKTINIPAGVNVSVADDNTVTVQGAKETLTRTMHRDMKIAVEGNEITVSRPSENKLHRSLHGLTRTLIANMIEGVTTGYSKSLEIQGIGYRSFLLSVSLTPLSSKKFPVSPSKFPTQTPS